MLYGCTPALSGAKHFQCVRSTPQSSSSLRHKTRAGRGRSSAPLKSHVRKSCMYICIRYVRERHIISLPKCTISDRTNGGSKAYSIGWAFCVIHIRFDRHYGRWCTSLLQTFGHLINNSYKAIVGWGAPTIDRRIGEKTGVLTLRYRIRR